MSVRLVLGSCSLCGGRVTAPSVWWGINVPPASCESCGAVEVTHGPVIPMQPAGPMPRKGWHWWSSSGLAVLAFAVLSLPACASLSNLTRHAAQAQRDTAALVVALDSYLEQCEGQEPRPSGCAEAGRLRAAIEPYVGAVE